MIGHSVRNLISGSGSALLTIGLLLGGTPQQVRALPLDLPDVPLELSLKQPPLNMLVMGRDHTLYYEAYNDASDLNDDGLMDVGYKPATIDYFGYFDSYKCYSHDGDKFVPASVTADKTCTNAWSGDFLNYVTTARIDALRKVLYGGKRLTDTTSATVLERTHIPQDAHSWGKEYQSIAHDGYDIRDYTPLALPDDDHYHLFANTTLLNGDQKPLMRVLANTEHRVWEWLSIERPVAGNDCFNSSNNRVNCISSGTIERPADHPNNATEFQDLVDEWAVSSQQDGTGDINDLDGTQGGKIVTPNGDNNNPYGDDDYYLTIVDATLNINNSGTYWFAVNGDDAVEVLIDGAVVAGWYGGHGKCGNLEPPDQGCLNNSTRNGSKYLSSGTHTLEFRHEERTGGDNFALYWKKPGDSNWSLVPSSSSSGMTSLPTLTTYSLERTTAVSTMTDYPVRVEVCKNSVGLEDNCKLYDGSGSSIYKPTGILHDYGEEDRMKFGLLTGSYKNNTAGGVLRKNVDTFTDEVDLDTGIFTNTVGIVKSIDRLITIGFGGSYVYDCGWITTRPINNGECSMWGNPIGEMMYESMRYFMGKSNPTPSFVSNISNGNDSGVALPKVDWVDPYGNDANGDPRNQWCAQPFQTVISDVNVSYDTDQMPGSAFATFSGDVTDLDVEDLGDTIWDNEPLTGDPDVLGGTHDIYIGQVGNLADSAPTPKTASSFGNIRGLSPEAPTKLGGYYSASVAYFGLKEDLRPGMDAIDGGHQQSLTTFAVALASPLPRIRVPISGGGIVELVPFAKSVGGSGISNASTAFQPTNQIVDFYVEQIVNDGNTFDSSVNGGRYYAKFGINYEDVEQGADHDMDAIITYTVQEKADGDIQIDLSSDYAAGGIIHHLGYVITGTTADGIYLEVRDRDTGAGSDPDYFLDTPNTTGVALPLSSSRTFTPSASTTASAIQLKDPLWLAAKWGGFIDNGETADGDDPMPDVQTEWDEDNDGDPDNYFLVTNALTLKDRLDKAFSDILDRAVTAAPSTSSTGEVREGALIFRVKYDSTNWAGDVVALDPLTDDLDQVWSAEEELPSDASRNIFTAKEDGSGGWTGIAFSDPADLSATQLSALQTPAIASVDPTVLAQARIDFLRGDQSNEGTWFREREAIIGDVVDSKPLYVGAPVQPYPEGLFSGYQAFRAAQANRTPTVYVGTNGGMLHAIRADSDNASSGSELFAYIPNAVFDNLSELTTPSYSHRFYVNGSPNAADVKLSSTWKTILVSGLGKGGQALFALDITDPDSFAATDVLWEFDDSIDADLGYTFARPAIRPTNSGHWVAIFGNGYNNTEADGNASATGHGVVFVVDLATGSVLKKFDTLVGDTSTPNGIPTVADTDLDGDAIVDYIYAGDLYGNLWKIDMRSDNPSNWDFAYYDSGDPVPLFQATDDDDIPQPITSTPVTGPGILFEGQMVYFGTGKYLENIDKVVDTTNPEPQTFYGIWDRYVAGFEYDSSGNKILSSTHVDDDPITTSRDTLLEQTILYEGIPDASVSRSVRVTSDNFLRVEDEQDSSRVHQGWYMDLVSPNGFNGERQVSRATLRNGAVVFATLVPNEDPCQFGNDGFIMIVNALSGGRLSGSGTFDTNGDGAINQDDLIQIDTDGDGELDDEVMIAVSGAAYDSATGTQSAVLLDSLQDCVGEQCDVTRIYFGEDELNVRLPRLGRQSWYQLR